MSGFAEYIIRAAQTKLGIAKGSIIFDITFHCRIPLMFGTEDTERFVSDAIFLFGYDFRNLGEQFLEWDFLWIPLWAK